MLEIGKSTTEFLAESDSLGWNVDALPSTGDRSLEFKRDDNLVELDDQVREYARQERGRRLAGNNPDMLISVFGVAAAMGVDLNRPSVGFPQHLDYRAMRHAQANVNLVPDSSVLRVGPASDSDASLSVEQAGDIPVVQHLASLSNRWNDGEFGGHPMPGPSGRGRAIPSQAGDLLSPGVCNEHVPSPKGKMCSGLHGNVETPAEMTGADARLSHLVTVRNTKYFKLVMKTGADFIPTPFVTPTNQAAKVAKLLAMLNLISDNRRRLGIVSAITAPA